CVGAAHLLLQLLADLLADLVAVDPGFDAHVRDVAFDPAAVALDARVRESHVARDPSAVLEAQRAAYHHDAAVDLAADVQVAVHHHHARRHGLAFGHLHVLPDVHLYAGHVQVLDRTAELEQAARAADERA